MMVISKYNFTMVGLFRKFVNWFLNLLYGPLAYFYDMVAFIVSMGYWHQWTYQIGNFLEKNDRILEVGIGTGKLFERLKNEGYSIIGTDRSKEMIVKTQSKNRGSPSRVCRADNLFLPFRDNSFTKVIATFPSDYAFKSHFLMDVKRVLEENGELIILMGVRFSKKGIVNNIYRFIYWVSGQTRSKENIEKIIKSIFVQESSLQIYWLDYKNVELCFVRIKNN